MKKYAVVILTVLCLCTFVCTGVSAESYEDNAAYNKLLSLDMIDERTENGDVISRGEFCGLLLRYLDISVVRSYQQTEFTDVPLNSEYFYEITTAYEQGLAFGSENRMFYPDEPIKLQDVCVMLVRALGYDDYMELNSYTEYVSMAVKLGITEGVGADMSGFSDYSDILTIFENCLDVKILEGLATFGNKIYISECETVLEYKKGIKSYKGVVTANRFSSLADAAGAAGENEIGIDGIIYDIDGNYDSLIGCSVNFYLNEDEKVVYIEKTKKNNEMLLLKEDIKNLSNDKIEYYTDDKQKVKKVKLSSVYVLFNDEAVNGYGKLEDIQWNSGGIRLLDNNNDNVYETVFFYEYGEYVVGGVNLEDEIIYDKISGKQIKLDQDNDAVIEIYNSDMERIELSEIKTYDVLNVLVNGGGRENYTRVYLSDNSVSGLIEEKNSEDKYVIVDGEKVRINSACGNDLKIGDDGTIYTNIFGIGIYFEKNIESDGYLYGVLQWHNVNQDGFDMGDGFYLTLFNSQGDTKQYKLADAVRLNGFKKVMARKKAFENVAAVLAVGDVIRYKASDDVITDIYTAETGTKAQFRLKASGNSFYYNDTMLNGELYMDGKTAVFNISTDNEYSTMTYTDLRAGYNYATPYKAYTFGDENSFYAVAVVFSNWKCETYFDNSNVAVVEKCKSVYDNYECEMRTRIYFTETMLGSEYTLAKGLEQAEKIIQRGDIIRYQLNSKKEISRITIVMREDKLKGNYTDLYVDGNGNFAKSGDGALIYPNEPGTGAVWLVAGNGASMTRDNDVFYCNCKIVYATVDEIQGNYVVYSVKSAASGSVQTKQYVAHANSTTYCTDVGGGEIKAMNLNDVTVGDTVLIQMYSGTIRRLIVMD